ncbi:hypothetical protein AALB64_10245 [Lachnospiraceae bacterium 45-P1]
MQMTGMNVQTRSNTPPAM